MKGPPPPSAGGMRDYDVFAEACAIARHAERRIAWEADHGAAWGWIERLTMAALWVMGIAALIAALALLAGVVYLAVALVTVLI